ncbi:restriction endonuclease subunit S [Mycoplasma sp. SH20]|uniref:restriction endonuclease subunit S n=1 Tax=Mycoplasma sp. SH20 TaxID=3401672 RepID=UPI003AAAB67C
MLDKKMVPEIRFKGFKEEWKEFKLDNLYSFLKGSNISQNSFYKSDDNRAIAYGHLYTTYGPVIFEVNLSSNEITPLESRTNDLLFPGSSTVPCGTAQSNAIMIDGVKLGGDIICARPIKNNVDSQFLSYQINSHKYKLYPLISGTTISHMYGSGLKTTKWEFPCLSEQVKISEFFNKLEDITKSQKSKLEKLQTIKQSLLDKMFTSCDQKIPEIRFKGFDKKWSEKCIDELFSSITDFTAAGSFADMRNNVTYYNKPNYAQLIRITDLKNEFKNANSVYVDKHAYDFLWRVQLNKECIVISNIGNWGEAFYIDPNKLPWEFNALAPNAIMLYTSSNSHKFLLNAIKTFNFQNILKNIISPNGQTKFNKTEFKELNLIVPTFDEQQKIGQFFSNLDSLIHSQEQKLEKLNNIKQALLEKMFC